MEATTPPDPPGGGPASADDYQPPRFAYIAIAVTILVVAVGVALLFGGGSSEPAKPAATDEAAFMDGTLIVVEPNRLVLRPADSGADVTFSIRPQHVENFDIAHLQSHSSVGIPTRLYYQETDGVKYAIYKEDAPVNSQ